MSLNEEEVITYMSYGMIASMTCAFICLSLGVTAPYGRYSGDMSLGNESDKIFVNILWI